MDAGDAGHQLQERTEREPHIAGSDRRLFRAGRSAKVKYADDCGKQASERQAARSGTGDASPVWQRSVKLHPWPWAKKFRLRRPRSGAKWSSIMPPFHRGPDSPRFGQGQCHQADTAGRHACPTSRETLHYASGHGTTRCSMARTESVPLHWAACGSRFSGESH